MVLLPLLPVLRPVLRLVHFQFHHLRLRLSVVHQDRQDHQGHLVGLEARSDPALLTPYRQSALLLPATTSRDFSP